MSETARLPLTNYVVLVKEKRDPYHEIIAFLSDEMTKFYEERKAQCQNILRQDPVLPINPRLVQQEVEKRIKDERLTTRNVCRTIQSLQFADGFKKKDLTVSTTSSGRANYHLTVNDRTLTAVRRLL